jgi:hypothetical protein
VANAFNHASGFTGFAGSAMIRISRARVIPTYASLRCSDSLLAFAGVRLLRRQDRVENRNVTRVVAEQPRPETDLAMRERRIDVERRREIHANVHKSLRSV